ncbi:MAG: KEOPS complex subunit Pcc1 [Sulfolobales archaeon]
MNHKIVIIIEDISDDLLSCIYRSLKPEESIKIRGVELSLTEDQNSKKLVISIESQKLNNLRATLYSTLRLINLTIDVIENLT